MKNNTVKKYFIQTFGCAMNQADSEKVHMVFLQSWFIKAADIFDADIVLFNTCSVRKKWEDRVFGMIREIKKHNAERKREHSPLIKIGITGCMVRKTWLNKRYLSENTERNRAKKIERIESSSGILNCDDKLFPRADEIDFVFRIEETKYIPLLLTEVYGEKIGNENSFDDYLKQKQMRESNFSANIIIQTGCDNYCTFCIVPFTRGKEISRPMNEIIQEAQEAVAWWAKEINLIWQNVNSYGKQFVDKKLWNEEKSSWDTGIGKSPFRELLEQLDSIEWLDRIRFTSSNPHDMTQDILDAHFELDSLCNYLHFALQSWSDAMLKKMNRKHSYHDFKKTVEYLRSRDPEFSISTDIIVGYSGETEEMFQDTITAMQECQFDFSFTARYSVRPDTIAAKIYPDDISNELKAERWHTLNNMLLDTITKRNTQMLWKTYEVLISGEKDGQFYGRTRNFKEVFIEWWEGIAVWDIVNIEICELDRYVLKGKPAT